jgi:hypothetical protein
MADLNLLMKPYLSALEVLGGRVVDASDGGTLLVELGDLPVYLVLDTDDTAYLRVWLPAPLEGADVTVAQAAAMDALERTKCVKVVIDPENEVAIFSIEMLVCGSANLPSAAHLAVVFPRIKRMLVAGLRRFHETLVLSGIVDATDAA